MATNSDSTDKLDIHDDDTAAQEWLANLTPADLLRSDLFTNDGVSTLRQEFQANSPFPHLVLQQFIDEDFLAQLCHEVKSLEFKTKHNDLYFFFQSALDLKAVQSPLITKFREILYSSEFVQSLSDITGIPLYGLENESQPDLFAAVYQQTSRLLCHDDELEGRRIAFILYLVDDWDEEDGGHLDLFASREVSTPDDQYAVYLPDHIAKSIRPSRAQFNFFEVSERSFHQVREVLSANKDRISIGGWFHGPPLKRNGSYREPCVATYPPRLIGTIPEVNALPPFSQCPAPSQPTDEPVAVMTSQSISTELDFWLNKIYRKPATIRQAVRHFGQHSSIELHDLLKPSLYTALLYECEQLEHSAFKSEPSNCPAVSLFPQEDSAVQFVGPVNIRCYYRADPQLLASQPPSTEDLPEAIQKLTINTPPTQSSSNAPTTLLIRFYQFLRSPAFFQFLLEFTGCGIASSYTELQLFRQGCYTLSHDDDPEINLEGLDVRFTLLSPSSTPTAKQASEKWTKEDVGGSHHYLLANEDEELITIEPTANSLSLVYRSGNDGVLQFTKYIDSTAPGSMYLYHTTCRLLDDEAEPAQPSKTSKKTTGKKKRAAK